MTHRAWAGLLLLGLLAGCGRPGMPVPPDSYGIGARVQMEKKKEERARKEQEARDAAVGKQKAEDGIAPPDEITLPEMRPVGGR
jgi:hypothetical protein